MLRTLGHSIRIHSRIVLYIIFYSQHYIFLAVILLFYLCFFNQATVILVHIYASCATENTCHSLASTSMNLIEQ
jgi:hypothetical protein